MAKIAVFVGSLRKQSLNMKLAKNLEVLAPSGMTFNYVDINLPLFNEELVADYPAAAQAVKDAVASADGVLFVTPEYNRSVPGVLKNAIDWASQPITSNAFTCKPVGIVGASIGAVGTAMAQSHLRHIAAFLSMKQFGQPEIYMANATDLFDKDGVINDERWRKNLTAYMETFGKWVEEQSGTL